MSFTNFLISIFLKHPKYKKSIINYDIITWLIPMILNGATIGTNFHSIFPNWFFLLLLVILVVFSFIKTFKIG
jgi:uncharacterized membrane protein YfcA